MKIKSSQRKKEKTKKVSIDDGWSLINPNAAGIDLGAREHWVAVPAGRSSENVRSFQSFTSDLDEMAKWLKECGITDVAMEATGVYWIPVFQSLERAGFKVLLVNARQVKNVSGRKSDVADCQWIQRLHSYGLLGGSFRPADVYCVARSLLRYHDELVGARSVQVQHMQKALQQMNIQLTSVLSNIAGESGLRIIGAILEGARDPVQLAKMADWRVKSSTEKIAQALIGDYREEHLFVLKIAFELFHTYEAKIDSCLEELTRHLENLPDRVNPAVKPLPPLPKNKKKINETLRMKLYEKIGADLTQVEGLGAKVGLTFLTEVGSDLSSFPTEKHFTSWLGVCPDNRISGGKILKTRTRRVVNKLTTALRMGATTLERSQSALGAQFRRLKAKLGAPQAITAMAHKLARILFRLVKYGDQYVARGLDDYERKHRERTMKTLRRLAENMGMELIERQSAPNSVS